jgi:hypothetical protein
LSLKQLFISNQGFQKAIVKTLLVSALICIFTQLSFPTEAERLPIEDMLK